jgi:predicted nucleic acid-binding protein
MMEYGKHNFLEVLESADYGKHVSAMTTEDLHSKAAIAEELAWRDIQITRLTAQNEMLVAALEKAAVHVRPTCDALYKELSEALAAVREKP